MFVNGTAVCSRDVRLLRELPWDVSCHCEHKGGQL